MGKTACAALCMPSQSCLNISLALFSLRIFRSQHEHARRAGEVSVGVLAELYRRKWPVLSPQTRAAATYQYSLALVIPYDVVAFFFLRNGGALAPLAARTALRLLFFSAE